MSVGLAYLLAGLAFGSAMLVRWWLRRTYAKWSQVPNQFGVTGAQAAEAILRHHNVSTVKIERTKGALTDHYDSRRDILRLSQTNFDVPSVAAMAVAAHEAGHALQDAHNDFRLRLRHVLVPAARFGSSIGPMVVIAGFMTGSDTIIRLGALLLAGMMVFQIATLPVEFNASRRAADSLEELGLSDPTQRSGVNRVLMAAAFTYVAAAATSLAYFVTLFARTRGARI